MHESVPRIDSGLVIGKGLVIIAFLRSHGSVVQFYTWEDERTNEQYLYILTLFYFSWTLNLKSSLDFEPQIFVGVSEIRSPDPPGQ